MEYASDLSTFFKLNRKDVEGILRSVCFGLSRQYNVEYNEMYQELYLRIDRSDVLKRFDPSKSKLSTFFYNYANGRAWHIARDMADKKTEMVGAKFTRDKNGHKKNIIKRSAVYLNDDSSEDMPSHMDTGIVDEKIFSPEDDFRAVELREKIAVLANCKREFIDLIEAGFSQRYISEKYKIPYISVQKQWDKVKAVSRKLLNSEESIKATVPLKKVIISKPKEKVPAPVPVTKCEVWSQNAIENLTKLYQYNTLSMVAKIMGRSICSIKCALYKYNIKKV